MKDQKLKKYQNKLKKKLKQEEKIVKKNQIEPLKLESDNIEEKETNKKINSIETLKSELKKNKTISTKNSFLTKTLPEDNKWSLEIVKETPKSKFEKKIKFF